MAEKLDVKQGTLSLMVLKTLDVLGPLHGYGIARRIEETSRNRLTLNYGTLYPALLKLEQEGFIQAEWRQSENNRRAKFYSLTAAGFAGPRADDELREELQAHLEMETAEYIRRGMHPDEARRRALLASGGLTQAAEAVRDQRGLPWVEGLAADVRYALRSLRRSPAFTTVVVLTLALGIGANTAMFTLLRGTLLRPLPNRDGERLVYLRQSAPGAQQHNVEFSVPEVADYRTASRTLAAIAEY